MGRALASGHDTLGHRPTSSIIPSYDHDHDQQAGVVGFLVGLDVLVVLGFLGGNLPFWICIIIMRGGLSLWESSWADEPRFPPGSFAFAVIRIRII